MIYIRMEGHAPPNDWLERAKKVTHELENAANAEERNAIIDRNQVVWKDLKDWLLELSHGKCWFSEAKDIFSHFDVEHFRPKKKAKDKAGTEREGYWWLAFVEMSETAKKVPFSRTQDSVSVESIQRVVGCAVNPRSSRNNKCVSYSGPKV